MDDHIKKATGNGHESQIINKRKEINLLSVFGKQEGVISIRIIRAIFILACIIMGIIWAHYLAPGNFKWKMFGGAFGIIISLGVQTLLSMISKNVFEKIAPVIGAIMLSMVMGYALGNYVLMFLPDTWSEDQNFRIFLLTSSVLIFGFAGITLGLTYASSWENLVKAVSKRHIQQGSPKVVDTSVIIDGRIADICDSGFLDGTLIIPRFVLRELQSIADSADVLRRAKGRRGLDIIKAMQEKTDKVYILVVEDDYPDIREVDAKLLRLAADYNAKVMTNDYNLNKVAQIEGVSVLNINDLANAIKPAVLPDEQMHVKIIKEGKEAFQGVGYLDDGTMEVVDGGKDQIGHNVSVVVTSVLQTAAGRMIFGKLNSVIS